MLVTMSRKSEDDSVDTTSARSKHPHAVRGNQSKQR
jgi:hypothetical protein